MSKEQKIAEQFKQMYNSDPLLVRSPERVNILSSLMSIGNDTEEVKNILAETNL